METSAETKKAPALSNKVVIIAAIMIVTVVIAAAAFIVLGRNDSSGGNTIGYATEAKVMLDQNALQAAMDEAVENAKNGNVGLRYKNNAYSDDGVNFTCFIMNSSSNIYDMFLTIFADVEMTDRIFLSELVPPGSGFENITLEHALEVGDHTVYVALTQVDTDTESGEQVIKNQVLHTMDFHVSSGA